MRIRLIAAALRLLPLLLLPALAGAEGQIQQGTTSLRLDAVDVSGASKGRFVFFTSFIDKYFKPLMVTDSGAWGVTFDGERVKGQIEVKALKDSEHGVSVVLVFAEYEPFADELFEHTRNGVTRLLNNLRSADRTAVVTYGKTVEASGSLTPTHNEAVGWVSERKVAGLVPYMYDAIEKGLDLFPADFDTIGPNRALMVVTDGFDKNDDDPATIKDKLQSLQRKARTRNVRVNVVGVGIEDVTALEDIKKLAHYTNGTYREVRTAADVEQGLNDFQSELLGQHVLTLMADKFQGNKDTTFKVEVEQGGNAFTSGPMIRLVPERESHLVKYLLFGGGGLVALVLLGFVTTKAIGAIRAGRRDEQVADEGPELVPCNNKGEHQIPPDWLACKYCEALPHLGRLVVQSPGPTCGRTWFIRESMTNIGSSPDNAILIPDRSVSKRHAGIKVQDNRFELADFGSTNGVLINGQRITKQYLKSGDKICIGTVELEFTLK